MKSDLDNKLVAVVRVRGRIGVRRTINETLSRLNLDRVNCLALVFGTPSNLGMIKKCTDFVTFGEINSEVLGRVLKKKGTKATKEEINALISGEKRAKDVLKLPIRLKPPRHGFESTKLSYPNGGAVGYRGEAINDLLKRMA